MKRLMKIKLINWHRFLNETIEVGDSVLLSGENGAGKSTLLDAIQFVITASKNNFNKAAHENGKRKLSGYVRCKTGIENRPYERTGNVTCHVALEFYDEDKKVPFIVGAAVDSASEDSESCIWYRMEKQTLKDSLFIDGKYPRNISNFRTYNKDRLAMTEKVMRGARADFKRRFGRLEDKFFELIPKSLAFKPIDDIKDFVYSYVLDKKEVNIESLRENVRTFKELEILLNSTRRKIEMLEKVCDRHASIEDCLEKDKFYEYFLARMDVAISKGDETELRKHIRQVTAKIEQLSAEIQHLEILKDDQVSLSQNLYAELANNEEFQLKQQMEKDIDRVRHDIDEEAEGEKKVKVSIARALDKASRLASAEVEELAETPAQIADFVRVFSAIDELADFSKAHEVNEALIQYKKTRMEEINLAAFRKANEINTLNGDLRETELKIQQLSARKLDYGRNVEELKAAIEREFIRLGRSGEVRILCQLLSLTDESWRNAVEGYMNSQKFHLLVNPEDFDLAVSVYDRLRKKKKLYGVGVINTAGLEGFEHCDERSLAAKVSSENRYAKRYVNMIMGKVITCDKPEELKRHSRAITKTCMRYQNQVVSVLSPKTYEIPYIGQEAYRIQLENMKAMQKEQTEKLAALKAAYKALEERKRLLTDDAETEIKYRLDVLQTLRNRRSRLKKLQEDLRKVSASETLLLKQQQYQQVNAEIKHLEKGISDKTGYKGQQLGELQKAEERLHQTVLIQCGLLQTLEELEVYLGSDKAQLDDKFDKIYGTRDDRELREIYAQTRKGNLTKKEGLQQEMVLAMMEYKSAFEMGAEASMDGYGEFEKLYHHLKDSQLLSYESKVAEAKESAEIEFREQFLSKLQENIVQARTEFSRLNKSLETIPFGGDYYKFEYFGSRKYREYYDMIMDDFNVIEGISLLSGQFHERHRKVIDELFEKLTCDEDSAKVLDEFTDYRTYMDYDIRIDHGQNSYSYYSKVCEEKSGGETQTPFYVTVAASFMQLYSNAIGGDSIGLILLDEAFNNMDDERISGVLEFFKKLPLQIIVAAPPDKIQYIQPSINHTLLVLKEGGSSYVEKFDYEKAQ